MFKLSIWVRHTQKNMSEERIIKTESDTRELGLKLAEQANAGDVIALVGDLGTGKTALTRYIAEGLGIKDTISSPTFTIVKEYKSGRLPLYHFDVYRLGDSEEFYDIGGEDYLYGDGLCVIEWAEIIEDALPENTTVIRIEYGESEGERLVKIN